MYCMKCGRAIADDKVFCAACSAAPIPVVTAQVPQKTKTVKKPAKKKAKKAVNYKPICTVLSAALVVLVLLFGAVTHLALQESNSFSQRKEDLRQKEAAVALREKEADSRDARIEELEQELEQVKKDLEEALKKLEE